MIRWVSLWVTLNYFSTEYEGSPKSSMPRTNRFPDPHLVKRLRAKYMAYSVQSLSVQDIQDLINHQHEIIAISEKSNKVFRTQVQALSVYQELCYELAKLFRRFLFGKRFSLEEAYIPLLKLIELDPQLYTDLILKGKEK